MVKMFGFHKKSDFVINNVFIRKAACLFIELKIRTDTNPFRKKTFRKEKFRKKPFREKPHRWSP